MSVFTQDVDICRPDCVDEVLANPELCDLTFTTNKVLAVLSSLDVNKASAQTKFQLGYLRKHLTTLPLHSVNSSINRLDLAPSQQNGNWLTVPVYKKDNKEYVENYRPISLLCLVSKVMERCLLNAIKYQV